MRYKVQVKASYYDDLEIEADDVDDARRKAMTEHEYFIQGLMLGRKMPLEVRTRDFWLKIKSVFRNSHLYFNR